MKEHVEHRFNNWIRWKFKKKSHLIEFFLNHERKELCITNVCKQLTQCEIRRPGFNTVQAAEIIDFSARLFTIACIQHQEQKHISQAEKSRIRKEGDREADYEEEQKELRKEFGVKDDSNDKSL